MSPDALAAAAGSRLQALRAEFPAGPILVVALGGCAVSMLAATLAIRLHEAGFSGRAIGFNAAAAGLASLSVAPIIPAAAARLGTVRLLFVALTLAGIALAGFAVTSSFMAWLLLRAVEGGCAAVIFTLGEYWITTRVSDTWRGLVIGLYVAGVAASFALGPFLLTMLDARGPGPLLVGVALFVVAALVLHAVAGGAPPVERRRRSGMLRCYVGAPAIMLAATLHGTIETAGLNLLPVSAASAGAGLARGALFTSLFILGSGVLQLPIGVLAGRVDRSRMLVVLAALAAAGAVALAAIGAGRPLAFAVGLVLWGGIVGSFYPVGLGELPRRFDGDRRVGANSAYVQSYAVGVLLGPPLVGAGIDLAPGIGFFAILAALNLLYLATALLTGLRAGRRAA